LAIPIVGILLISGFNRNSRRFCFCSLRKAFGRRLILAEVFSITSVFVGILASFYLNLPAGGAIVLTTLIIFVLTMLYQRMK